MTIKKYIIFVLLLSVAFAFGQQQTLYTNYLMNQYLYNPAYAGVEDGTQFNLGYRNQWVGFEGSPKTYMVSGYGKFKKKPNMAVGGLITSERIGLLQRTSFYGTYSYHLKINKKADINFGIGAGGIQYKVRVYDARPYDKDDSFLASDILRAFAFDANAGFYFYTKNFFLGFSDQHMPNSKILWSNSTGRNTNHLYAYSGYNFHLSKEFVIQPSILWRSNNPAPYLLEYTAKMIYDNMIWAGFTYRHQSTGCFLIGAKIDQRYSFAYSYDFTLSDIKKYTNGSHELVFSFLIPYKKKKSKSELEQDADEEELNKIDNSIKTNLKNKKKNTDEEKEAPKTENNSSSEIEAKPETENNTDIDAPKVEENNSSDKAIEESNEIPAQPEEQATPQSQDSTLDSESTEKEQKTSETPSETNAPEIKVEDNIEPASEPETTEELKPEDE